MTNKYVTPIYFENDVRADFDRLHDEIYESLGRFIIAFEGLLYSITQSVKNTLFKHGLSNEENGRNIADILLSEMESMKLVNKYTAIFSSEFSENKKEIRCLGTKLRELVENRNEIVHGKFIIHLGTNEGEDFLGYNHKTRFSLAKGIENYPKWYFKDAYNTSTILQTYVELLNHVHSFPDSKKFLQRVTEENIKNRIPVTGCRLYDPSKFL